MRRFKDSATEAMFGGHFHKGFPADLVAVSRRKFKMLDQIGISAETALRLSKALDTSVNFWVGLQMQFDIETAKRAIGKQLDQVRRVNEKAA